MPDPKDKQIETDSLTQFENSLTEALYGSLDEVDDKEPDDECSPSSDGP